MKQYLYSIVVISVTSALFRILCPDSASLKKYFSFLTSAVLLCGAVAPISGLIKGFAGDSELMGFDKLEAADYSAVWLESICRATEEECEYTIAAHICEKFGISEENISVGCLMDTEDGNVRLSRLSVTLYSGALLKNPRQIESYLEETFKVPSEVSDGGFKARE